MSTEDAKRAAAEKAVSYVKNGMTVGLGTGSTAFYAIEKIGELRLQVQGVPTSLATERLAKERGIPIKEDFTEIDITIDGADEVDKDGCLIKGGGGALTREKIVAAASQTLIIIVDSSKRVEKLGSFPLPVEVVRFGWQWVQTQLIKLGCRAELRRRGDNIFLTDNGNFIFDCHFGVIDTPTLLGPRINQIPGVLENGLFVGLTHRVIYGFEDGRVEVHEIG